MRRPHPAVVVLAVLLPILLVAGIWIGGHPEDLPGFARPVFVADNDTRVVNEALARIHRDYYRPVSERQLANASLGGAVASLHDRFSHYLTPAEAKSFAKPSSFSGIGVEVAPDPLGLRVVQVFNSSPAARAGLKDEEVIVAVNGRRLAGLSETAASDLVKGPPGTNVTLGVRRRTKGGRSSTRTVTITRATISEPVVASATVSVHGVKLGIVTLAEFVAEAHTEVRQAVEHELHAEHVRGLLLDLRGNPGGLVEEARLIASIFLPRGATVVSMRGRVQPSQTLRAEGGDIPASIPMVVLVDRNTASAAEILTGALQDHHRATVVGTHTFGKGVFQEEQPLSNGGALDITVGEYFTPNGRNLGGGGVRQGAGITPEVAVPGATVDADRGLEVALRTLAAKAAR
ncbi:MAG TPA: S41 family peptidase [Solirubrobacteraceae bacterium]|nr:S41 family peptidase [Solirubrobacteraceae bacterium]